MAKQLLVLEEALVILEMVGVSPKLCTQFRDRALGILAKKVTRTTDSGTDTLTVASGFGQKSQKGFVDLTVNEVVTQMEASKARELGVMLIEAAEAAISDQIFITLLRDKVGIDAERAGHILIDLREIRQGTRGIAWPQ